MASQAAADKKVRIRDNAVSAAVFADSKSTTAALNQGGDLLDDTNMATSPTYRSRIYGLRDWSVTITLTYDTANAVQTVIRNAWLNRTELEVQYLPDGTVGNGFQGVVLVESFNASGDVAALETVDVTLQANGAIAAAT